MRTCVALALLPHLSEDLNRLPEDLCGHLSKAFWSQASGLGSEHELILHDTKVDANPMYLMYCRGFDVALNTLRTYLIDIL